METLCRDDILNPVYLGLFQEAQEAQKIKHLEIYTVNGYKSKGALKIDLDGNGQKETWYCMKTDWADSLAGYYEIFFDPKENQWLKVAYIHPEGQPKKYNQLKKSIPIAKAALSIAGLDDIVEKIREYELTLESIKAFGFTTPHIGITLEQIAKWVSERMHIQPAELSAQLQQDTKRLFFSAYQIAYHQAEQLFLDHGYWIADPNAGNIVLAQRAEGVRVAMIDVVSGQQIRDNSKKVNQSLAELKKIFDGKRDQALKYRFTD